MLLHLRGGVTNLIPPKKMCDEPSGSNEGSNVRVLICQTVFACSDHELKRYLSIDLPQSNSQGKSNGIIEPVLIQSTYLVKGDSRDSQGHGTPLW